MKIKQTTLENGLRIVTATMAEVESVSVNIAVGVGSRYEEFDKNGGASHFLEHLLFKGTAKYPTAESISQAVDAVGGYNNAYTTEDMTSYYIKVPAAHCRLALDILADMMTAPLFDPEEVHRERGVIIEEMNVWRDDPARFVNTLIPELIFPDSPLGHEVIGPEKVIRSIKPEKIAQYMHDHYRPDNMVVAVAGKLEHDEVVEIITESMGSLNNKQRIEPSAAPKSPSNKLTNTLAKPTSQAHFMIGSQGYAFEDKQERAAKLLSVILGRGMSSRLFSIVRERQGLAYTVSADHDSYADTGIFTVYAGVNLDKVEQALTSVINELARITREPVAEAELNKAKQQMQAGLLMSQEANTAVADRIGSQLVLLGKIKSIEDTIKEVEAVTIEDIKEVAKVMLAPSGLRLALISPEPAKAAAHFSELINQGV